MAVNDPSTLLGRHSFKKTMIAGPFNPAGLKGTFHCYNPLCASMNFLPQHAGDFATNTLNRMSKAQGNFSVKNKYYRLQDRVI